MLSDFKVGVQGALTIPQTFDRPDGMQCQMCQLMAVTGVI